MGTPEADWVRSQRKRLARLPEEQVEKAAKLFPDDFERNALLGMFALRSLARRISDYTDVMMRPYGINAAKYNYITVLLMSPEEELTLSELSQLIHTSNATVTGMIKLLQSDGLVRRTAHRDDARSVVVRLTPKGRRLAATVIPIHQRMMLTALADVSLEDRARFFELLMTIGEGFDRNFGSKAPSS